MLNGRTTKIEYAIQRLVHTKNLFTHTHTQAIKRVIKHVNGLFEK